MTGNIADAVRNFEVALSVHALAAMQEDGESLSLFLVYKVPIAKELRVKQQRGRVVRTHDSI